MNNIWLIFGSVGLVYILTHGYITQPIRNRIKIAWLGYMVNCPQCIGFWMGFWVSYLAGINIFYCILHGGLVSLLSSFCASLLELMIFCRTYIITKINLISSPTAYSVTEQQNNNNE